MNRPQSQTSSSRPAKRPSTERSMMSAAARLINLLLIAALLSVALAWFKKGELPRTEEMRPELSDEPIQKAVKTAQFEHVWQGKRYNLQRLAEYEISGLVVTHNNPAGIGDIYHDDKSIDIKDLCLIWGDNISTGAFHKLSFWSESFSCWYKAPTYELNRGFVKSQLSNNHLLPADWRIAERIAQVHVGDQIRIAGLLVNYSPANNPEMLRKTSLTREDTGNGACEVLYVKELEILKAATPGWYRLFDLAILALLILVPLKIVSFALFAWLDYKLPD